MATFIKATIAMRDSNNYLTRKTVETRTTVLATAQAAVDALLSHLNPVTDLTVDAVTYSYLDGTQTLAGEAESNVDLGATFIGKNVDGEKVVVKVPGFPQSKVGVNGGIDLSDVDVAAFLDHFEGTGDFYVSDGETVAEWVKGYRDKK